VADDAIVEIRDVERAIGSELCVHGAEPRVIRGDEIGSRLGDASGAQVNSVIAKDGAAHHVADENAVVIFLRP